jgi:AraC-like DNA-binding protein
MRTMKNSTAVKPGDCFDHWHQVTCRSYSVTECRPVVDQNFRAQVAIREFGTLVLSDISSATSPDDLIEVDRTPGHIRKDYRDDFQVWLAMDGEAVFAQNGREARMRRGDLVLHDQAQPFALRFGPRHRAILITIPRPLLIARLPTARNLVARRIASDTKLGMLAATVVTQLVALEEPTDEVARRISAAALDILATTLQGELMDSTGETSGQQRRLLHAKRYISANLHDTRLDLEMIANAQNMSPRTLNRLFAREGTTPIRWLWQQRLAASFKALAEGHVSQVTDAALSFGFSDPSHFSRAFKAAFGQSPQNLVRSACSRLRI